MSTVSPIKDTQTITPEGMSTRPVIHGVNVRQAIPIEDRRGEIIEIYRPSWGYHEAPLVYIYQVVVRPKAIRGWVLHEKQDDRIFVSSGVLRWVMFDDRLESPTRGLLNDFTFSDRTRTLFTIPCGVFHAVQNVGDREAVFINMPTRPYDHQNPDKFRLPLKNDRIPFSFDEAPGW